MRETFRPGLPWPRFHSSAYVFDRSRGPRPLAVRETDSSGRRRDEAGVACPHEDPSTPHALPAARRRGPSCGGPGAAAAVRRPRGRAADRGESRLALTHGRQPARVAAQPGMGARCRGGRCALSSPTLLMFTTPGTPCRLPSWSSCERADVPTVMTVHNYRLMCLNGMFLRDGRPCEDCLGRSPWPGVQHRCYHDSTLASAAAAMTLSYNRHRDTWGRGIALYLAPTAFVRDRLVASGISSDRVWVHPHFVADPGPRSDPPSHSRVVLHVGRLRGTREQTFCSMPGRAMGDTDLELVCIGDGPLRDEIVRSPRQGSSVGRPLPPQRCRHGCCVARVLVAPSTWYETFGLVVAEAMAAGFPVIVPRVGALAEVAAEARPWSTPSSLMSSRRVR